MRFKHCVGKKVRKLFLRQHTLLCCVHARAFGALGGLESLALRLLIFFLDDQKKEQGLVDRIHAVDALKMLRHKTLFLVAEGEHLILIGFPHLQLFLGRENAEASQQIAQKILHRVLLSAAL